MLVMAKIEIKPNLGKVTVDAFVADLDLVRHDARPGGALRQLEVHATAAEAFEVVKLHLLIDLAERVLKGSL